MKIRLPVIHSVLIVLLAMPVMVRADAENAVGDWTVLQSLQRGEKLSVKLMDDRKASGSLTDVSEDMLVLSIGRKTVIYSKKEVVEIRLGPGRSLKKPILLGALIGAGGGAALGGAAAANDKGQFFDVKAGQAIPIGAAVGAAFGTAVGAVVGLFRDRGELIYRIPQ